MEEFVTIAEVGFDEAALIKTILEGQGITAWVDNEHSSALGLGIPARVKVSKAQAAEALKVLESANINENDDEDDFDDEGEEE